MIIESYWNSKGKHQPALNELQKMIPASGSVPNGRSKNRALEKLRKAVNCYYDLYNNGLYNRASEFARVFGIPSTHYKMYGYKHTKYSPSLYEKVESIMNDIIIDAAIEQGVSV